MVDVEVEAALVSWPHTTCKSLAITARRGAFDNTEICIPVFQQPSSMESTWGHDGMLGVIQLLLYLCLFGSCYYIYISLVTYTLSVFL